MKRHLALYATATRYDLAENTRNTFAMLLVVAFVPTWITLIYLNITHKAVPLHLDATGEWIAPAGNRFSQITGALNAVTLITGFMMFAATFKSGGFDRRLVMAGYPRAHLVLAKTTSLALASAAVAVYATAVISVTSPPEQPFQLAAALFGAALTYGAIGVIYGSLLRREVEGMFAMIMTGVVDVGLQNPLASPGGARSLMRLLPSYGAVQSSTASCFSTQATPGYLALQFLWFAAAALVSLLTFRHRTRTAHRADRSLNWAARAAGDTARPPAGGREGAKATFDSRGRSEPHGPIVETPVKS
ncbi:ABC transporter permease [Streptomyces sp. NPDC029721]|uniref:ABC transporter permease n=1 Tax=Streptomyces sp. NPDC029721 TaxID=3157090 RepID=UPI0033D4002B